MDTAVRKGTVFRTPQEWGSRAGIWMSAKTLIQLRQLPAHAAFGTVSRTFPAVWAIPKSHISSSQVRGDKYCDQGAHCLQSHPRF